MTLSSSRCWAAQILRIRGYLGKDTINTRPLSRTRCSLSFQVPFSAEAVVCSLLWRVRDPLLVLSCRFQAARPYQLASFNPWIRSMRLSVSSYRQNSPESFSALAQVCQCHSRFLPSGVVTVLGPRLYPASFIIGSIVITHLMSVRSTLRCIPGK